MCADRKNLLIPRKVFQVGRLPKVENCIGWVQQLYVLLQAG
jgi:hypothetical protein